MKLGESGGRLCGAHVLFKPKWFLTPFSPPVKFFGVCLIKVPVPAFSFPGRYTTGPPPWCRDEEALLENTERVPDRASPPRCRPTDTTRLRIHPGPSPA